MIDFNCPRDGTNLHADEVHSGKVVRCPKCGDPVVVPGRINTESAVGLRDEPKTVSVPRRPSSTTASRQSRTFHLWVFAALVLVIVLIVIGVSSNHSNPLQGSVSDVPYLDKFGHLKMFTRGRENIADAEGYIPAKAVKDASGAVFYVPAVQSGASHDNGTAPQSQIEGLPPGTVIRPLPTSDGQIQGLPAGAIVPEAAPLPDDPYAEFGGVPLTAEPNPNYKKPGTTDPTKRKLKGQNQADFSDLGGCIVAHAPGIETSPDATKEPMCPTRETSGRAFKQLPPARTLPNGTVLNSTLPETGKGYLELENRSDADAVFDLVSVNNTWQTRQVYVSAKDTARISSIPPGVYRAVYALGTDWDSSECKFTRNPLYKAFPQNLSFEEKPKGDSVEYASYQLKLHVENGNVTAYRIPESEFSGISRKSRPADR